MHKGDQAHDWANEIFSLSEKCLMAHSIKAVEVWVDRERMATGKNNHFSIRVRLGHAKKYLGRRAIAVINGDHAEIQVDSEIGHEYQRLAVAHELAHILFWVKKKVQSYDVDTESACGVFEKALCKKHDEFYSDPKNIARLRFSSIQLQNS